jgi:hypothetical protein
VTRTKTEPLPGGTTAFIAVLETTVNEVAAVEPNVTAAAFVKPVPLMATVFSPAAGPLVGLTLLTTGAAI